MNALVFLGIAAGLSLVGCMVLWLRSRQPGSMDAHIRDFARELDALAPGSPLDRPRSRQAPRGELPTLQGPMSPDGLPGGPPRRGPSPEQPGPEGGRGSG